MGSGAKMSDLGSISIAFPGTRTHVPDGERGASTIQRGSPCSTGVEPSTLSGFDRTPVSTTGRTWAGNSSTSCTFGREARVRARRTVVSERRVGTQGDSK